MGSEGGVTVALSSTVSPKQASMASAGAGPASTLTFPSTASGAMQVCVVVMQWESSPGSIEYAPTLPPWSSARTL